jgi:mannosyltransferase
MTLRGGSAAIAGVVADAPLVSAADRRRDRADGSDQPWLWLLPAVVTGVVIAIGITTPSYWRDEAATMAAVHRPASDLVRMLGNVDAVHGAYYLLVWPLARLFGSGELVMRLPSLLAMAIAAGAITATGRRLATPAVGLIAGLAFAAAPSVTEFGQMARSYALVTMAAAIASYALVRALADAGRASRWVWYAVSVAVLGALNIAALLLVPAHGIMVWLLRRNRGAAGLRPGRSWLIAAATGSGLNVPLVLLAFSQRSQVKWLPPPSAADLGNALDQLGPPLMTAAIAVMALAAVAVAVGIRRRAGRADPSRADRGGPPAPGPRTGAGPVAALCVPWLAVPPVALLLLSALITPLYNQRYILFCMPAAALMTGVALAELARVPGPRLLARLAPAAALAVVVACGLGLQAEYRQPAGHADNIHAADAIISAEARPGDVMMYTWPVFMPISAAYPDGLATLPDIQVGQAAISSGTLAGTTAPRAVIRARIGRARRLWIIQVSVRTPEARLLTGMRMRLASTWRTSDIWLQLYVHDGAAHRNPAR